jgi:flagellar biosynthesis GTPase FlhF
VLPATMKTVDLERLARAYRPVDPLGVALTRCDDTSSVGEVFSALVETGLGLAYTTHLDTVSDPPRGGDNLALAHAIMTGDWETRSAMPRSRAA